MSFDKSEGSVKTQNWNSEASFRERARLGTILAPGMKRGGLSDAATTTVTHFTDNATVQAITDSGGMLFKGTYVTTPGEIPAGATRRVAHTNLNFGLAITDLTKFKPTPKP
ncbi:MAG TPA: hypothetical protein VN025_15940 [Candidatus Dormibacteraeota bacterium]|nr:hypothetical protein [Candidatus Dormibacteraeota bacterium]